ncbi:FkbM family methyltransferase [Helicobacter fennelliae]|uniref:Methyltransferase FkbM domain-containing protein n=2 Tax=Helicobacter TaxID=209 RepID=T1DV06_9HELI|nr:FkbM family methyltransferase [Helicobacter fennelliae]GAD18338.1 hypothetical protein HFN_1936 [Helicobacter fennelliae MRY12-0050]
MLFYYRNAKPSDLFFVDIGANDGVSLSNTYALDGVWGGGILIEADSKVFASLQKNRQNPKVSYYNIALFNQDKTIKFLQIQGYAQMLSGILDEYDPRHLERIEHEIAEFGGSYEIIEMQSMRFSTLMRNHPHIRRIDYMSIDVEGGEMKILESLDFENFDIGLLGIENNYKDFVIPKFLKSKGYKKIFRLGCDEFYAKR